MAATEEQTAVINHRGSPLLIPAVPGSGKTYSMCQRCVSLLREGVSPERILVMMFNVSAREDFTRRLSIETKKHNVSMPEVQTFHAFGMKLCKAMERKGMLPAYRLEDKNWVFTKMAKAALVMANEGLDDDDKIELEHSNVEALLAHIEFVKNEFKEISKQALPEIEDGYIYAIKHFEDMRHEARLRSFTDLIYDPAVKIASDEAIQRWVGNRYDHMIGDEAQDMNQLQIMLMTWIAGSRAEVCIVGDEDQSVYAWRGGRPEYMVHLFEKQFPNCKRLPLTATFRYGHQVALMANHVISKNQLRTEKLCLPQSNRDTKVEFYRTGQVKDGHHVGDAIQKWTASGRRHSETVVLVREYSHTVSIEAELLNRNIPYKIVGASPFFERKEALSIRGLLSLVKGGFAQVLDIESRKAMIKALLSVPTSYLKSELIDHLADQHYPTAASFLNALKSLLSSKQIGQSAKQLLNKKINAIEFALRVGANGKASLFLRSYIDEIDLKAALLKESAKYESAIAKYYTISQIVELADSSKVPTQEMLFFLDGLKVRYDEMSNTDPVLITSAHRSKGLEWPHVILPFLSEGTFPAYDLDEGISVDEMESERRLFFVAITRCTDLLSLIHPTDPVLETRAKGGTHILPEYSQYNASRFLYESNMAFSMFIADHIQRGTDQATITQLVSKMDSNQAQLLKTYLQRYFA